ncbi:Mediator of RNA polymerase II transcription subunit 5 [Pleurostoma richardsiae]|uniref:Mediator of RNA polymerase II transcription subunit 5 n=1 Tax=Pleurostoma richardsiae TaxID=41990 RepID=A0AA38VC18_9PEZI|nr:Mediator of RNA polymerase II transcription subunit 5 [Pleurostoma richardsiae]
MTSITKPPGPGAHHHHHSAPRSLSAARGQWTAFLDRCLVTRLDLDEFEAYVPLLQAKHPLPADAIADIFLRPSPRSRDCLDSRVHGYLQALLDLRYIDTPAILKALYKYSTSHTQSAPEHEHQHQHDDAGGEAGAGAQGQRPHKEGGADGDSGGAQADGGEALRWRSSYGAEEVIFYRLTKAVAQGTGIRSAQDGVAVALVMARWMTLFTAAAAAFAEDVMGALHSSQSQRDEMEAARAAFVMLLLGVCENQIVLEALSKPMAKDARKALSESLATFVPSIMQGASQIAARLELFRTDTLASFEPASKKEAANTEIDELLDSTMGLDNFAVADLHIENSRAGLYIYLNASLVGRPLIDDNAIYNYLHNRYQGDIQTTAIDLILASFDVLANAVFRNEGQKAAHLLRSYLINKVPLILASFAASASPVYPFNPEYCITEALSQVDTNAFPTLSSMFDDTNNNNTFTDSVRQDFCFACCLHGLVPETSIETLLGEITYQTLPAGGRYVKEDLVQQCLADHDRMLQLVGELDNMDGNVGAVCQALTEMLGRLCANKETMSLKALCSHLARKPLSLDVLLLFDKPGTILHPLCDLLDNWRYDEDQGEYQPVYEEFGSILLLLLAFVYRYNLSIADLGARAPDSFVAKLLSKGHLGRPLDDLSDQEKGHLDGWIHGLFDTDAGGLGDELMSSCPPQDFYLLIPALFHNIVLAFSTGYLVEESLKGGVEYLVDTFLLPSLVTAIMYLSNCLWADPPDEQKAIVRILQLILLPNQISNEASTMLSSLLNIVAKPLEHSLRMYQRQDPKSQEVEPLLRALKENLKLSRRTGSADHNELEAWTSTANGGLTASIRHTIQGLVQWSLHPGMNIMPTSYTHRQILVGLKILGAKRLLRIILEEVKQQTEAGSGGVAYDVGTALVCAPDVANDPTAASPPSLLDDGSAQSPPAPAQRRLSLREALKFEAEEWKKIQKASPVMAETVVRLYRRVEAQMVQTHHPPHVHHHQAGPGDMLQGADLSGLDGTNLGDAIAAAAAAGGAEAGDAMAIDAHGMDLGLGAGSAAGSTGGLDLGGDQDMFSGLGSLDGWEGMGMDIG